MRRLAVVLVPAFILMTVVGCASRRMEYTLTKANVSQAQLLQDVELLRGTSGVKKVIPRHDSANGVSLELYLDEDNTDKGLRTATDLGYQQVRN